MEKEFRYPSGTKDTMDLAQALKELHAERQRLIVLIANMEALRDGRAPSAGKKRRGRKSMGSEEREQVSKRMKRYWAKRRKQA